MTSTMQDRVSELGITISTTPGVPATESENSWGFYTWTVTLSRESSGSLVTPWNQGSGLPDAPDAATVLDCLASDAATIENTAGSFEDWASELGYDTDSREAERIWREANRQTNDLRTFLGDAFEAVVFETENL